MDRIRRQSYHPGGPLIECDGSLSDLSGHAGAGSVEEPAMPTYQYRCTKCSKVFERSEHVAEHEKAHPRCPKCNSTHVEPVLADFYAKTSKKS
jgi:putative FmdB family regulatory protein